MKQLSIFLCLILLFVSCSKEKEFFIKGKKVESGLIWEKTQITADEILKDKKVALVFEDNFDRPELGAKWESQTKTWQIMNGTAFSPEALNRNLILKGFELPENAVIELDLRSESESVDIKFNVYGDGSIQEHGDGYTFLLGGWHNRISVISRLNEHEENRVEERATRLQPSTVYHCKVIKLDNRLYWFVNDKIFLAKWDDVPLRPVNGNKYLSLANWKSMSYFDNLKIYKID